MGKREIPPVPPGAVAISIAQASVVTGLSEWKIRQLIKGGEFPVKVIDGRIVVPLRRLEEWMNGEAA